MHFGLGVIQRREEVQALEVIHVQVCQQDIHTAHGARERRTKPTDAGARTKDEHGTVRPTHFHTRGVAAIPCRFRARCCYIATRRPESTSLFPYTPLTVRTPWSW